MVREPRRGVILLGGTWFVGRTIAEAAVGAGHELLIVCTVAS